MKQMSWLAAQALIENHPGLIFLEFSTSWCGDCHMMKPFVAQVEEHFAHEQILFIEVDAEAANTFRKNDGWDVLKVPSFFVINNGKAEHIGYEFQPVAKLITALEKYTSPFLLDK